MWNRSTATDIGATGPLKMFLLFIHFYLIKGAGSCDSYGQLLPYVTQKIVSKLLIPC